MNIVQFCSELKQAASNAPLYFEKSACGAAVRFITPQLPRIHKIGLVVSRWLSQILSLNEVPNVFRWKEKCIELSSGYQSIFKTLENLFGFGRVRRVCERIGISIKNFLSEKHIVFQEDLQKILLHLFVPVRSDYEEVLQEIHGQRPIRASLAEERQSLQKQFSGVSSLREASDSQIEQLEKILIPLSSVSDALLKPYVRNKGMSGLFNAIFPADVAPALRVARIVDFVRRNVFDLEDWEGVVGKRFGAVTFPEEAVIRHPKGYLVYTSLIVGGGARKLVFQPLSAKSEVAPHLIYGGTVVNVKENLVDDLIPHIGLIGTIGSFKATGAVLQSEQKRWTLLSYSLGAAHAQRDMGIFLNRVQRLVTVASPGIDTESNKAFFEKLRQDPHQFEIVHNVDKGDLVPHSGDGLLGISPDGQFADHLKIRVRYYVRDLDFDETNLDEFNPSIPSVVALIRHAWSGFISHIWTPALDLEKHTHKVLTFDSDIPNHRQIIQWQLNRDHTWFKSVCERVRVACGQWLFAQTARDMILKYSTN